MIVHIFIIFFVFVSIVLSFKYRFAQLHFLSVSKKCLKKSVREKDNKHRAFLLSLGNHIGTGNIVGVCSALAIGGIGSIFWMSVCLFFTSIYSLMENSLGIKYNKLIEGEYRGGSPYYILYGLKNKILSYIFAILLILSSTLFFLPVQVNSMKASINGFFEIDNKIIFFIFVIFCVFILFRGTKKILAISDLVVPFMTVLFVLLCLLIIIVNIKEVPNVLLMIFKDAIFDIRLNTILGSIFGGMISIGLRRSVFSNEAGIGTAPTFNSMVNGDPIEQAYLQVLACFIDTVVMCTLFALVVIFSGINYNDYEATYMSIIVFEKFFESKFGLYLGSLFLFFFSFATIIGSYYSGETNSLFICNKKTKIGKNIYRILFVMCIFLGIFMKENELWELVDYGIVILGIINVYVIVKMRKEFEKMMKRIY